MPLAILLFFCIRMHFRVCGLQTLRSELGTRSDISKANSANYSCSTKRGKRLAALHHTPTISFLHHSRLLFFNESLSVMLMLILRNSYDERKAPALHHFIIFDFSAEGKSELNLKAGCGCSGKKEKHVKSFLFEEEKERKFHLGKKF